MTYNGTQRDTIATGRVRSHYDSRHAGLDESHGGRPLPGRLPRDHLPAHEAGQAGVLAHQLEWPPAHPQGGPGPAPVERGHAVMPTGPPSSDMAGNSGRPRDLYLTYVRAMFPEWSERTVARFARATRLLCLTGCSAEVRERVLRRGRRPWGGFNVAAYLKAAE